MHGCRKRISLFMFTFYVFLFHFYNAWIVETSYLTDILNILLCWHNYGRNYSTWPNKPLVIRRLFLIKRCAKPSAGLAFFYPLPWSLVQRFYRNALPYNLPSVIIITLTCGRSLLVHFVPFLFSCFPIKAFQRLIAMCQMLQASSVSVLSFSQPTFCAQMVFVIPVNRMWFRWQESLIITFYTLLRQDFSF